MKKLDVVWGWKTILAGRTPFLSIEITKECPLTCPGCYAYGDGHLGGNTVLRQVSDFRGKELVDRVIALIDAHKPVHVSLVGGEPLVRFKELGEILPQIESRGMFIQLVTSAVRPIPVEWNRIANLDLVVSIDGLPAEHDIRRKPATYERILQNIKGHGITAHCTVTRQMTERPGYLREFMQFWSAQTETKKIWISLFTPQIGETSYEIVPWDARHRVIDELLVLRREFPKLAMPERVLEAYRKPPADPSHCVFARTTTTITANLRQRVTPCQFGGNPDCSQCGCVATAGMEALAGYRIPYIGIRAGAVCEASLKIGAVVNRFRPAQHATSIPTD
jgi:sulfatase maturation enzyme AslB (radical SAM superfamily)